MKKESFVGIDIAHRTIQAVRLEDGSSHEWFNCKTNGPGLKSLANWVRKRDFVVLESGSQSFLILSIFGTKGRLCCSHSENAGDVAIIYGSLKKTDKEDSLKLARLAQRNPVDELPTIDVPSEDEEMMRRLTTEHEYFKKQQTAAKNRLYGYLISAGITDFPKKALATHKNRARVVALLPQTHQIAAERLLTLLQHFDSDLKAIHGQLKACLQKSSERATIALSMPGVGPITTLAILGFIGKGDRFSSPQQVGYYVGLVPKVDKSGKTAVYGPIIKRGCRHIRRPLIQAAWSLVRSEHGGHIKVFYEQLTARGKSKKVAIVATARKMIETMYVMLQTGELYNAMPDENLNAKLKTLGLIKAKRMEAA